MNETTTETKGAMPDSPTQSPEAQSREPGALLASLPQTRWGAESFGPGPAAGPWESACRSPVGNASSGVTLTAGESGGQWPLRLRLPVGDPGGREGPSRGPHTSNSWYRQCEQPPTPCFHGNPLEITPAPGCYPSCGGGARESVIGGRRSSTRAAEIKSSHLPPSPHLPRSSHDQGLAPAPSIPPAHPPAAMIRAGGAARPRSRTVPWD